MTLSPPTHRPRTTNYIFGTLIYILSYQKSGRWAVRRRSFKKGPLYFVKIYLKNLSFIHHCFDYIPSLHYNGIHRQNNVILGEAKHMVIMNGKVGRVWIWENFAKFEGRQNFRRRRWVRKWIVFWSGGIQ